MPSSLLMISLQSEGTPLQAVMYGLCLYFLGLSFRGVQHALDPFVKRSHTAVWKWVQRCEPHRMFDVMRVQAFLVDETYVKVGSFKAWVWVAAEPVRRYTVGVYLSRASEHDRPPALPEEPGGEVWEACRPLGWRDLVS
jgi:transposase-like protein